MNARNIWQEIEMLQKSNNSTDVFFQFALKQ